MIGGLWNGKIQAVTEWEPDSCLLEVPIIKESDWCLASQCPTECCPLCSSVSQLSWEMHRSGAEQFLFWWVEDLAREVGAVGKKGKRLRSFTPWECAAQTELWSSPMFSSELLCQAHLDILRPCFILFFSMELCKKQNYEAAFKGSLCFFFFRPQVSFIPKWWQKLILMYTHTHAHTFTYTISSSGSYLVLQ